MPAYCYFAARQPFLGRKMQTHRFCTHEKPSPVCKEKAE